MSDPFPALADRWRERLVVHGFSDDGERLRGPVPWTLPEGTAATARVEITPPRVFPFYVPRVVVLDAGSELEPTFHIFTDDSLCLWEDEWDVDEAPWRDPGVLLTRIAGWLESTAAGWPGDDSCDLERYLERDETTFVLYDATALILDAAVHTMTGTAPGVVIITDEPRRARASGRGRQRRRDTQLAWVADIGAIQRPLRNWSEVAAALGGHAAEVSRLIRNRAVTLLLLRYTHGGAAGALALRVGPDADGIRASACESADTSAITRGLRAGPAAAELTDVRIAVVGCGAIGSFTADLLFRSGVRRLTLSDNEKLRPGNVVRHLADSRFFGWPKTEAVRARLAEVDPDVTGIQTVRGVVDLDDAIELVRAHLVVVDATGSARTSSLLATAADREGRGSGHTVVSVCVQRAGDVVRVDRMPLRGAESHLPALPLLDESGPGLRERGCGSPISPTPPGAVLAAADLANRVVLDEATRDCTLPATMVDVRVPQPEPPYDRPGLVTSATPVRAAAS